MESTTVVSYRTEDNRGVRSAIVKPIRGNKLRVIYGSDQGAVMKVVKASEAKFMQPLLRNGKPYSLKRACNKYLAQRDTLGLGKLVKKELKKIKSELREELASI